MLSDKAVYNSDINAMLSAQIRCRFAENGI